RKAFRGRDFPTHLHFLGDLILVLVLTDDNPRRTIVPKLARAPHWEFSSLASRRPRVAMFPFVMLPLLPSLISTTVLQTRRLATYGHSHRPPCLTPLPPWCFAHF